MIILYAIWSSQSRRADSAQQVLGLSRSWGQLDGSWAGTACGSVGTKLHKCPGDGENFSFGHKFKLMFRQTSRKAIAQYCSESVIIGTKPLSMPSHRRLELHESPLACSTKPARLKESQYNGGDGVQGCLSFQLPSCFRLSQYIASSLMGTLHATVRP